MLPFSLSTLQRRQLLSHRGAVTLLGLSLLLVLLPKFGSAQAAPFENFEADPTVLSYRPLSGNSVEDGSLVLVGNPDTLGGGNPSARVGKYVTGDSENSTLEARSASALDLSATPELSALLWAPAGTSTVRAFAAGASGRSDAIAAVSATEQWITVSFDFAESGFGPSAVSAFGFVFDEGVARPGRTFYLDDLRFAAVASGACTEVEPDVRTVDDFECQRNAAVAEGGGRLVAVTNPETGAESENRSVRVGQYRTLAGEPNEFTYNFDSPLDLAVFSQVELQVWAAKPGPLRVTLAGSLGGAERLEKRVEITELESWQTYSFDFRDGAAGRYTRLSLSFDEAGTAGGALEGEAEVYYLDNLNFARGSYSGCVSDFETAETSVTSWFGFENGSSTEAAFAIVDNPEPGGPNTSAKVGRFIEASDAQQPYAGIAAPLGTYVEFPDPDRQVMRITVWAPIPTDFVVKLENPLAGGGPTRDVFPADPYTAVGEWQVLTFDFRLFNPNPRQYERLTLIPGFGRTPAETIDVYFDDIILGDAYCGVVGTQTPRIAIEKMRAYPNPASGQATVVLPEGTAALRIVDGLGRTVQTEHFDSATVGQVRSLDVSALPHGLYRVIAQADRGQILARVSLVVE